jgi:hypothetical protein
MTLSNKNEVILVGGNKELMIFNWEEGEIVEFHREPYRNVIEIAVCDNWFAIKYKKKKAKLFRILPDDDCIEIDGSWDLKLKPFKGVYRTLELQRFRKNQLIILDSSFKTKGYGVQLELFDVKQKKTVTVENFEYKEKSVVTAIIYSPKLQTLTIFDESKFYKIYKFKPESKNYEKSGFLIETRRLFQCKGTIIRVIMNRLDDFYLIATSEGEIFIFDGRRLMVEETLYANRTVVDVMICDKRRRTMIYAMHNDTKDFKKFVLHQVLGNLLMDRDGIIHPQLTVRKCISRIFKLIERGKQNENHRKRDAGKYQKNSKKN